MKGTFTFLGTGASMGVPIIGCKCQTCSSQDPKDRRLRPSGLIQIADKNIIIDVGPDFRAQALKHNIDSLDGVFLTHIHADHIAGVDDLRIYFFKTQNKMDCFLSAETFADLKVRYAYLFKPINSDFNVTAQLKLHLLEKEHGHFSFLQHEFSYVSFSQGGVKVNGFRIGDLAYLSDIKDFDEEIFDHLKGVNTLILSAVGNGGSKVHLSLKEAVAFADRVGAKKAYFTHLSHHFLHEKTNQELPENRQLAYDGLKVAFSEELCQR